MMKKIILIFLAIALLIPCVASAKSVTLAWDASPDPITSYKIFYGEQSVLTNPSTEIDVGKVLQFTIPNVDFQLGKTYYFALKACYYNNISMFSEEVVYTVGSPLMPYRENVLRIAN